MPKELKSFLRKLLDLREGADDKHSIIENVKDDSDFSSARFWTLVFAIGAASVGLNINSIPVVIGAMLISPLMGPVVSMGLSLAINDWRLMRRSFRNLLILVVISIGISTLYFAITPITNAQSELLSRIQPTIFDVLIAVFGGMAGFIGVSRARHNNVIPGVAIATALMPPLCTVGYGIGTLQPNFIFGAFYLFLINCIFICLSALVVAKYMKLPKVEYPDQEHQKQVRRIITAIIIIIVTPAIYFAYTFVQQNNFKQNADEYIKTTFEDRGYVVIYKKLSYLTSPKNIEVAFLAERFSQEQLHEFEARLFDFGLDDTKLSVRQNEFALTSEEWNAVMSQVKNEDEKALALEARVESEKLLFQSPERILEEAKAIEDKVVNIAIGSVTYGLIAEEVSGNERIATFYTSTSSDPLTTHDADVLRNWIKTRLEDDSVITNFIPSPQPEMGAQAVLGASTTIEMEIE